MAWRPSNTHSVPNTYGLASIDIVDRGVGVSATSTRGSGVLSTMMSGANIENVNGGGRSQYTGVKLWRGDSGVASGVLDSSAMYCNTHDSVMPHRC